MRIRRFIHMILLLGVCGLAWQAFLAWAYTRPPIMAEPSPDLNTALPSFPQAGPAAGKKLVGVITAKNLFAPSRRTENARRPPAKPPPTVPPPDHLSLVGVFIVGDRHEALFADSSKGGKVTRVRSGDTLDSYHLAHLTHAEATLAFGAEGREVSLRLNTQKSTDAAKAPRIVPARSQEQANSQTAEQERSQPDTQNSTRGTDSTLILGAAADSGEQAGTRVKKVPTGSDQDEAVTIRQNIRQLQRRLREIRRQRARERRAARAKEQDEQNK